MDKLQEIINTLSEDDKREFRIFINRQKSKKERKDLDLFELIGAQTHPKEIQKTLYKTPNKIAYHTLRKRLLKHLTDFIVLKQIDGDTTAASSISGLLSMAAYLFKNESNKLAWRFLLKAELLAIQNDQFELLNNIYQLQLDASDSEFAPNINLIYNNWSNNKKIVDENERINIAYNFIKKELNEFILKAKDQNVNELVENLLKKYGLNDTVFERPEILYKVLSLTRKVKFSKKDFYSFEPYIIEMYQELITKHGFSKKNHFYKIHILYMIAHVLYRNRKFKTSIVYLNKMYENMRSYNKSYYKQFYTKHLMLSAANYSFLNQNKKAIDLLEGINKSTFTKLPYGIQLNIKMILVVYLGFENEFKKCNQIILTLNHSDNWLTKKMGIEWVLKKNMLEIMIQYELNNHEIALNKIRSFERNYSELFNHPIYSRSNEFIQTLKAIIIDVNVLKSKDFIKQVKSTFIKNPIEHEDLQAISYYAWLKAKMMNLEPYDVLLDITNSSYEN
ncbi:MAG: hypothetical protein ACPGSL_01495 [Vicingaceae bacterium]